MEVAIIRMRMAKIQTMRRAWMSTPLGSNAGCPSAPSLIPVASTMKLMRATPVTP